MSTSRSAIRLAMAVALILPAVGCTHLFYHPTDLMYAQDPAALDRLRTELEVESGDGTKLAAWWFPARAGKEGGKPLGTVVQFHGNAQNMTAHFASVAWMIDEGYNLLTFDYRGYGISEGKPSQEGLNRDALAAIREAIALTPGGGADIVLYGQSLGGAVLLRAYQDVPPQERKRVRALVVEGSFDSYRAVARDVLSRSWTTYLLQPLACALVSDAYSPEEAIPKVSPTRLLVIHGDSDPVVPERFGKRIFDEAREPKQWLPVAGGGHIDAMSLPDPSYRRALLRFIKPTDPGPPSASGSGGT